MIRLSKIEEYDKLHTELVRISKEPYLPEDHEKNHQTFAKVLLFILEEVSFK